MRRVLVILVTLFSLIAVSCGGETVTAGGELLPTPAPAPTVGGVEIEPVEQEVQAEIVFIGVSSDETVQIRALPGIDQPFAADVPPGTRIEKMREEFETEDGLLWWQVRAGSIQGWIQPNIAHLGPANDITDDVLADFDTSVAYTAPEDSAQVVAELVAADQGTSEIIIVDRRDLEGQNSTTMTVDLLGLGDDSLIGFRLLIASSATTGFQPVTIQQFPLCARGVSTTGGCL